jgi:enamine deaminase RidA (YjgF/YER057c/UK114 family)
MTVQHINPEGLPKNPAFTQGIIVETAARMLLIGGQNGVGADGKVVHKTDIAQQSVQAVSNVVKVLAAADATVDDLVRMTITIHKDADLQKAFGAWMEVWGKRDKPPVVSVIQVAGFANPDFLIEISGDAVLK